MSVVSCEQGVTLLQVDPAYDSLDNGRVQQFRAELMAAVDEAEPPLIVLDLSRTSFIGSSFIELVVHAWKRLRDRGGRMALGGVSGACMQAIQITNLTTIWDIYPTREAALQGLLSSPK